MLNDVWQNLCFAQQSMEQKIDPLWIEKSLAIQEEKTYR